LRFGPGFVDQPIPAISELLGCAQPRVSSAAQILGHRRAAAQLHKQCARVRYRAEYPTLRLDHFDRVLVVRPVGGAAAIFEQQAFDPRSLASRIVV